MVGGSSSEGRVVLGGFLRLQLMIPSGYPFLLKVSLRCASSSSLLVSSTQIFSALLPRHLTVPDFIYLFIYLHFSSLNHPGN